ncbi:zinc finger protein [Saxophila tyrrhenica]|uniref:Zinc finger protein n=1 Tax=Saxophila tyrrhenica TaxID=1690608 RepID=A0AAV9P5Q7_9PEZI|nr:zinc finger protein [Saxophila tyrrhenica]
MAGWTFATAIPTVRPNAHYCASCNTTAHYERNCPFPGNCFRVQRSVMTCWKCGYRGHTGDECQNPEPVEYSKRCGVCRAQGHRTEQCGNVVQQRMCDAMVTGQGVGQNRFRWGDVAMSGTAQQGQQVPQQQMPAFPVHQASTPLQTPPAANAAANASPAHLTALRQKAQRSAMLYHLRNYNLFIANHSSEIQSTLLNQRTWMLLSAKIAQGYQFWRDPRAMHAIATGKKPCCYTCRQEGVILDGQMCGVGGKDALDVEDFAEWGVFVMFGSASGRQIYQPLIFRLLGGVSITIIPVVLFGSEIQFLNSHAQ